MPSYAIFSWFTFPVFINPVVAAANDLPVFFFLILNTDFFQYSFGQNTTFTVRKYNRETNESRMHYNIYNIVHSFCTQIGEIMCNYFFFFVSIHVIYCSLTQYNRTHNNIYLIVMYLQASWTPTPSHFIEMLWKSHVYSIASIVIFS